MKKLISIALLLAMCLSLFVGCQDKSPETTSDLPNAKAYLINMYQTAGKGEVMVLTADKDVLAKVIIDGVSYDVAWTVKVTSGAEDAVKVAESVKANHVKLDIPEKPETDIKFTATATVKDADGNTEAASFDYMVKASETAGLTDEQIVEEAYKLENGEMMDGNATLTGVITMVKTPYDASYKNVTVIIQIGDLADKKIECYRMKGDGADTIAIGDTITVTGVLKNYNGTIEFDAGCTLDKVEKGETVTAPTDPKEIVDAAYALETGGSLPYSATLTGTITEINTPWDEGYQNISVVFAIEGCEDKPILCYRMKGDGAATLVVGDVITVTGYIINYKDTVEFTAGCKLDAVNKGQGSTDVPADPTDPTEPADPTEPTEKPQDKPSTDKPVTAPSNPIDIVDAVWALEDGEELPYTATLTGIITKINEDYSEQFKNITVTMTVSGREKKPIKCYRLKGTGVEGLQVGDTITVTGKLKMFYGDAEFVNCTLDKVVAGERAPSDPKAIVDAAYALEKDQSLSYEATLTGKVTEIQSPYDSYYKNITVVIKVTGREDKPILVYRLKGDGVDKIKVNDTITVTGKLMNYGGTIEFTSGCVMTKRVDGGGAAVVVPTDPKQIVDAAFALEPGAVLPYKPTLTGKIIEINTPYDSGWNNITVTIEVEGSDGVKELKCFRMKGDGADALKVGDVIKVTGTIKNYVHSSGDSEVEFDAGCTFVLA